VNYATHVTLKNADRKASKIGALIITESLKLTLSRFLRGYGPKLTTQHI